MITSSISLIDIYKLIGFVLISLESQRQPTVLIGSKLCRHLLYVVVIPLVISKIVIDEN